MFEQGVVGIKIKADASGFTDVLRDSGRDVEAFGGQIKQSSDSMASLANGLKSAFVGSSVAVGIIGLKNNIASMTSALVEAQVQVDKLRNGLNFAVGKSNSATELQFIRDQAKSLGLEFASSAQQYTKLAAAARGTSLEGDKIRKVFESVAQASTVMGLSAQETEGALLALTQIVSKGKVQAEELRGQLGERLPGAFQVAARAMGVTTAELDKMLETGKVLSTDFLPKFAAQLSQEVAPQVAEASKSMQASVNRLSSAWQQFKQTVAGSGISGAIANEASGIANYLTVLQEAMERAKNSGAGTLASLSAGAGTALARAPFDALAVSANSLNGALNFLSLGALNLRTNFNLLPQMFETSAETSARLSGRLAEAEKDLASLQARLKLAPENIYLKSETYQAFLLAEQLRAAKKAQDELRGGDATRQGILANGQGRTAYLERIAQEKKDREDALKKFNQAYATPSESFAAEVAKQKEALGELFTPEFERRIRDRFIKPMADATESISSWIARQRDLISEQLQGDQKLAASDRLRIDGFKKIQDAMDAKKIGTQRALELEKLLNVEVARAIELETKQSQNKAMTELAKERLRAIEAYVKEEEKAIEAVQKSALAAQANVQKYEDEEKAIALATARNISLASAIELVVIERLKEKQIALQADLSDDGAQQKIDAINEEIAARRKLSTYINQKDSAKATFEEWKRGWEETDSLAREVFSSWAESGGNAAEKIGATLKKALLSAIYEATLKPLVFQLYASITGGAPGATGNALERAAGVANAGDKALSWLGGGDAFAGKVSDGALSVGNALLRSNNEYAQQVGMYLGKNSEVIGAYAQQAGNILGYLEAATNFKDGSYGQSIGQGLGLYLSGGNPIFGQIGKELGSVVDRLFGPGEYVQGAGSANVALDRTGAVVSKNQFTNSFDFQTKAADAIVEGMRATYLAAAKSLGAGTFGASFSLGTNNSDGGKFALDSVTAGGARFSSGETKASDDAISLAAARAVFAALQGSELPGYLAKVFDGITASTATQDQISAALQYAGALKTVRDALLETRAPLDILKATVATSFQTLGTSAETFKRDFVAAIDAGISPESLAAWQALGGQLDALSTMAAESAAELQGWQDKIDVLTGKTTALEQERANALKGANVETAALVNQYYDLKTAANAAAVATDLAKTAKAKADADAADAARELEQLISAALGNRNSLVQKYTAPFTEATATQALGAGVTANFAGKSGAEIREMARAYAATLDAQTQAGRDAIEQLDRLAPALDFFANAADAAAQKAADAAAQLLATNQGLQDQLDILVGGTDAERKIALRNATDETTRALLRQIYAQQDLKTATERSKETLANLQAVAKSMADVKLDGALSGLSDFAAFFVRSDRASGLVGAFDGSLESLQSLASASNDMYREQLSLVQQIRSAAQSVSDTFSESIRGIQLDLLQTPEQKYGFFDNEAQKYRDILATLTDPQAISLYSGKLNSSILAGYGVLDNGQKQATGQDFIDLLNSADALVQSRFADAQSSVESNYALMATKIEAAVAKGIADGLAQAAADINTAADKMQTAADTPVKIEIHATTDIVATSELTSV